MNKILFLTLFFTSLIFCLNTTADDTFKGIGKQDVNVRIKPDYNSTIVYVLRKNQEVDIQAIVKTKNKGIWYKIDRGYVVTRFVNTEAKDIPIEDFNVKVLQDDSTQKEEISVKLPKEIKTQEVKEEVKKELDKPIEEEITQEIQEKQEEVQDIIEKKDNIQAIANKKEDIKEEEKTFIEPKVIKNEESSLLKYINLSYVFYALIAIVVLILLIVLIKKIFSRPSITDQISEHKRRSDSLKKALSTKKED